jgi:hypothetical protein
MYSIKGLSDAAMEQLGVCYLVNGILTSQAEMSQFFNYCDISSLIGRYIVHTFRELLARYPEFDPITLQDTGDTSSWDMWAFAKEYGVVGKHIFESIRAGRLETVPPQRQLICFYHQHGPDAACASRGVTFGEQIQRLRMHTSLLTISSCVEDKASEITQEESDGDRIASQETVTETT